MCSCIGQAVYLLAFRVYKQGILIGLWTRRKNFQCCKNALCFCGKIRLTFSVSGKLIIGKNGRYMKVDDKKESVLPYTHMC